MGLASRDKKLITLLKQNGREPAVLLSRWSVEKSSKVSLLLSMKVLSISVICDFLMSLTVEAAQVFDKQVDNIGKLERQKTQYLNSFY